MRALVTGAAGFVGSALVDALLAAGDEVVGVDCFTPYYDDVTKRDNLRAASADTRFRLEEADLRDAAIAPLLEGIDVVYHQAAQAGVRHSWAGGFPDYVNHNVLATQRLLEGARDARLTRFVYASSSSVYGNAPAYPTTEDDLPSPHSPYGVTKLAGEHLCALYGANWGVPTIALRYFTVYGPRQRPDMAIHRLVEAALSGEPFPLYGDGSAVRDFTFVGDVIAANLAAAGAAVEPGVVVNVAGGAATTVRELIELVGDIAGSTVAVDAGPPEAGDVTRTGGAIDRAARLLGWEPRIGLREGLEAQVAWHRSRR